MIKLKEIIAITALLIVTQMHNADAVVKKMEQSHSYPQKHVMYNGYASTEGNFVYAVCDDETKEKDCTVVQRQFTDETVTRSCNVTLHAAHADNTITDKIFVQAFGKENTILFWSETGPLSSFSLMALKFDDCEIKLLQLDDPDQSFYKQQINAHKIVTYDNDFDIFFEPVNASGEREVAMRIGFEAQPKNQTIREIVNDSEAGAFRFILSIATRSPDKGFVYATTNENGNTLWLVKLDGTKKLLSRPNMKLNSHKDQLASISAASDVITSCIESDTNPQTVCTQYDENGEVKFEVTLDHDDNRAIKRQVVHNTPRGGFLIMKTSSEVSDDNSKPATCDVVRVDDKGKRVGSVRLEGFVERLKNAKTHGIWENNEQYCAVSVGQVPRDTLPVDNIDVVVNCFTEDDFKM